MKLNRRKKEALGLSLIVSAVSLTVGFIVLLCRKRSLLGALAVLAAAQGAAGAALLTNTDEKLARRVRSARKAKAARAAEEEELFSEMECEQVNAHIRTVLGGAHDVYAPVPVQAREIPRDEDATEADFQ